MSSKNRDVMLNSFMLITQCSSKQATEYLEMTDWNEETAIALFFETGNTAISLPPRPPSPKSKPPEKKPSPSTSKRSEPIRTDAYESDDDFLQTALEDSLKFKTPEQPPVVVPKPVFHNKSIISQKINTVDNFRRNDNDSDDDDEGQAFYAGGSEQSGQQILGPPKARDTDKHVTKIFEDARKQGATEAHDEPTSSSRSKQEKPFSGAGYSLAGDNASSRSHNPLPSETTAAATNVPEDLPIRFYSNGFTVGDGELRKYEDNREFMDHVKRGEIPPELRSMNTNGRQIEVRLEDHRGEEYKRVAPAFKPFGGAGHTIGLSGPGQIQSKSSTASSVTTASATPDLSRLEQLAEKRLKTSSSSTTIRLRLPDVSTPICIKIDLNRTLGDVRRFLNDNVPSLQSNTFEFMEPPSTKIKREDEKRKISDAHLANSTLAVRRVA